MITQPMLAETIDDVDSLKFPVMVSPKLDGIRCLIINGKALTRKFKPVPNRFVREWLEANCLSGMDGELMVKGASFNQVQSAIMSEDGEPDFEYHVFDLVGSEGLLEPFGARWVNLGEHVEGLDRVKRVEHTVCWSAEDVFDEEEKALSEGYEGLMVRDRMGPYKCGRSTKSQGWLLKLKRFLDSEAEVIDLFEMTTNTNKKEKNELGKSKRSTKKEGMVLAGRLGEFLVKDVKTGVVFKVGTGDGLTMELRQQIWNNRDSYRGKFIRYKYQPAGQKDKPRFPVWTGFRDERDMS